MRSMSNSLISQLKVEETSVYGQNGFERAKLAPFSPPVGMTRSELASDLAVLDAACASAAEHDVVPVVATLAARTKSRAQGDGEARFSAATMVKDLSAYPIDVVVFACDYWVAGGSENKWMPSWPELKEICDRRMDGRLRLRRALVYAIGEAA